LPRAASVLFASSHCHSRSGREELVAALESFVAVDAWGGGCLSAPWRRAGAAADAAAAADAPPFARQDALFERYAFTLALENAACEDYATEKALLALARGSVPVLLGAENAADFLPARDAAVFVRDFRSARALAARLAELARDERQYAALHAWRQRPIGTYGAALRDALARALPVAAWARGEGGPATTVQCGLCYALQDASGDGLGRGGSGSGSGDGLGRGGSGSGGSGDGLGRGGSGSGSGDGLRLVSGDATGHSASNSSDTPAGVAPFECAPPLVVLDDADGTFVFPAAGARLESWGSGQLSVGPWLRRALAARARERAALGLPPEPPSRDLRASARPARKAKVA
jgi:hypothetical protein